MRLLAAFLVTLLLALAARAAVAEDIQITAAELSLNDESVVLNADFEFEFGARIEEALNNGIPLYFVIEFELSRSRWYWLDERLAKSSRRLRLWYHALTRQYRLSGDTLYQSFDSLRDAQRALTRLHNWPVIERHRVQIAQTYQAALRMRLDTSELPKPFQASSLANREWKLASDWRRWTYAPTEPAQ